LGRVVGGTGAGRLC